ncbi:MAG: hypothetical protein U0V74_08125 [Chitinophagales bacterium]
MRQTDNLQQLIQQLSTNEKRYFKLWASLKPGDKNYLALFDDLAGSGGYDVDGLSKHYGGNKAALAHNKEHLKDVLLRSLRNFHEESSIEIKVQNQLAEIEVLFSKKQFALCQKKTDKWLAVTIEYEMFPHALQLLRWHFAIKMRSGENAYDADALALESRTLKQLENLTLFFQLRHRFAALIHHEDEKLPGMPDKSFKGLMQHPLLASPKAALSKTALLLYHNLHSSYAAHVLLDHKRNEKHLYAILHLFEANPFLFSSNYRMYFSSCDMLCSNALAEGQNDKALTLITAMEKATERLNNGLHLQYKNDVLNVASYTKLAALNFGGQYKAATQYGEQVLATKGNLVERRLPYFDYRFKYLLAHSYFMHGQYTKALKLCQELLNENLPGADEYVYFNRFLFLLLQYVMGHYSTLLHYLKSHSRWCRQNGLTDKAFSTFVLLLRELVKAADNRKEMKTVIQNHKQEFNKLKDGSAAYRVFTRIAFTEWLESRIK